MAASIVVGKLGTAAVSAPELRRAVQQEQGSGRPINPEDRRMAVLAGLEAVDWVLCFEDDTPRPLLEALKPDVLVKGGDYAGKEEVVGWEIVEGYGGEVKVP